jgi:integrase/recombinase XerC
MGLRRSCGFRWGRGARMPRPKAPWLRADRGVWVCRHAGRLVTLGRDEGAARARWRELTGAAAPLTVAELAARYLAWVDGRPELAVATRATYHQHTKAVVGWAGPLPVADLTGWAVLEWLGSHPEWSTSTRAGYSRQAKRLTRWAKRVGLLAVDPLADTPLPTVQERASTVTGDEARAVIAAVGNDRLRDLLRFLHATGCRPGEAFRLTAADCDLDSGVAVLARHKTSHRTRKPRIIPLAGEAGDVVRRLSERHPEGALFRNRYGNAWTRATLAHALWRLARNGGPKITAYQFRSCWATDAAAAGVPLAVAAECLGNSERVLARHYVKLHQRGAALTAAAARVRAG